MGVHLDYETFSEVDLKKVGAARYAAHPSTEVLSCAYAIGRYPVKLWEVHKEPMPPLLREILQGLHGSIHAFNALFEMSITECVLGVKAPTHYWVDTAVEAYYYAFTGSMEMVAEQMELPINKQADGNKLIHRFCKPQPENRKVRRWTWENDPEQWARFMSYNKQDVEVERLIHTTIREWGGVPGFIYVQWVMDTNITRFGLPVDLDLIRHALHMDRSANEGLIQQLQQLTGVNNPNSKSQMKAWFESQGLNLLNMQKATLEKAYESC